MISNRPTILPIHIPPAIIDLGHLYWRISINAVMSVGNYIAIEELQFYDSNGTYLSTGGTATASTEWAATWSADKAFDNNFTTFWNSLSTVSVGFPQTLQYQFINPVSVSIVRIVWGDAWTAAPKTFSIQYSDNGTSWTTTNTFTNIPWSVQTKGLSFRVGSGFSNYCNLRAYILSTQDGNPPMGAEFELRTNIGGPDITAPSDRYTINNDPAGFSGTNLFDNNPATNWQNASIIAGSFVGQALSVSIIPAEMLWQASLNSGQQLQSPSSLKIQGSNDGINWTDIGSTISFSTWSTVGQIQVKLI